MRRDSRRLVVAALATPTAAGVLVIALVMTAFAAPATTGSTGNGMGGGSGGADSAIRTAACSSTGETAPGLTAEHQHQLVVLPNSSLADAGLLRPKPVQSGEISHRCRMVP